MQCRVSVSECDEYKLYVIIVLHTNARNLCVSRALVRVVPSVGGRVCMCVCVFVEYNVYIYNIFVLIFAYVFQLNLLLRVHIPRHLPACLSV